MSIIKWLNEWLYGTAELSQHDKIMHDMISPLRAWRPLLVQPLAPPTIDAFDNYRSHGGFISMPQKPQPQRKKSCLGCGSTSYTVKDDVDVCDYCGRDYERVDIKPNVNIKLPVFTTTGHITPNEIRMIYGYHETR